MHATLTVSPATAAAGTPRPDRPQFADRRLQGGGHIVYVSHRETQFTLAEPLPRPLAPGQYQAATLKYAPFGPPKLPDGGGRSRIRQHDGRMAAIRRGCFSPGQAGDRGSDNFDVEVWNELTFGSDFLDQATYYQPPPAGSGDVEAAIIAQTTAWLRNPANDVSGVGIGDGFENERPSGGGAPSVPAGCDRD